MWTDLSKYRSAMPNGCCFVCISPPSIVYRKLKASRLPARLDAAIKLVDVTWAQPAAKFALSAASLSNASCKYL